MSPLWRDQVRIVLSPRQVTLIRLARGWNPRIAEKRIVSCLAATPGEAPWRSALAALETALPEFSKHKADAVVILSNHFVRYTLVMHSNEISSTDEEQALARHSFSRIYGSITDQWALRLGDAEISDSMRVASAVDQELLESLRVLLQPTKLTLRSIQPYLMAAFNQWRQRFQDSAWFALVEQGRLCLAKFHHNQWHSIRIVKISDEWFHDLAIFLDRERLLSDFETADGASKVPVYVFAPGYSEPILMQAEEHSFQVLPSTPPAGAVEIADAPYLMAMIG